MSSNSINGMQVSSSNRIRSTESSSEVDDVTLLARSALPATSSSVSQSSATLRERQIDQAPMRGTVYKEKVKNLVRKMPEDQQDFLKKLTTQFETASYPDRERLELIETLELVEALPTEKQQTVLIYGRSLFSFFDRTHNLVNLSEFKETATKLLIELGREGGELPPDFFTESIQTFHIPDSGKGEAEEMLREFMPAYASASPSAALEIKLQIDEIIQIINTLSIPDQLRVEALRLTLQKIQQKKGGMKNFIPALNGLDVKQTRETARLANQLMLPADGVELLKFFQFLIEHLGFSQLQNKTLSHQSKVILRGQQTIDEEALAGRFVHDLRSLLSEYRSRGEERIALWIAQANKLHISDKDRFQALVTLLAKAAAECREAKLCQDELLPNYKNAEHYKNGCKNVSHVNNLKLPPDQGLEALKFFSHRRTKAVECYSSRSSQIINGKEAMLILVLKLPIAPQQRVEALELLATMRMPGQLQYCDANAWRKVPEQLKAIKEAGFDGHEWEALKLLVQIDQRDRQAISPSGEWEAMAFFGKIDKRDRQAIKENKKVSNHSANALEFAEQFPSEERLNALKALSSLSLENQVYFISFVNETADLEDRLQRVRLLSNIEEEHRQQCMPLIKIVGSSFEVLNILSAMGKKNLAEYLRLIADYQIPETKKLKLLDQFFQSSEDERSKLANDLKRCWDASVDDNCKKRAPLRGEKGWLLFEHLDLLTLLEEANAPSKSQACECLIQIPKEERKDFCSFLQKINWNAAIMQKLSSMDVEKRIGLIHSLLFCLDQFEVDLDSPSLLLNVLDLDPAKFKELMKLKIIDAPKEKCETLASAIQRLHHLPNWKDWLDLAGELKVPERDRFNGAIAILVGDNKDELGELEEFFLTYNKQAYVVQLVNQLKIPQSQRLQALQFFAFHDINAMEIGNRRRGELREERVIPDGAKEIVNLVNELDIPDENRFEAIESLFHMRVADNAFYCDFRGWKKVEERINAWQVPQEHGIKIVKILAKLNDRNRVHFTAFAPVVPMDKKGAVLDGLSNMSSSQLDRVFAMNIPMEEKLKMFELLMNMDPSSQGEYFNLLDSMALPETRGIEFLKKFAKASREEWQEMTRKLEDSWNAIKWADQLKDRGELAWLFFEKCTNEEMKDILSVVFQLEAFPTLPICRNLIEIPAEERENFCAFCKSVNWNEPIMDRLSSMDQGQRKDAILSISYFREQFKQGVKLSPVLLKNIMELSKSDLDRFLKLGNPWTPLRDVQNNLATMLLLSNIPSKRWDAVKQLVKNVGIEEKAAILKAFQNIQDADWDFVFGAAQRLIKVKLKSNEPQSILLGLGSIPAQYRTDFLKMPQPECLTLLQKIPQTASEKVRLTWWESSEEERRILVNLDSDCQEKFAAWHPETRADYATWKSAEQEVFWRLDSKEQGDFFIMNGKERQAAAADFVYEESMTTALNKAAETTTSLALRRATRRADWKTEKHLIVNENELRDLPHAVLLDLFDKIQAIRASGSDAFPKIQYQMPNGDINIVVDFGGPKRQFISTLFDALFQPGQKKLPTIEVPGSKLLIPAIGNPYKFSEKLAPLVPVEHGLRSDADRKALPTSSFEALPEEWQVDGYQGIGRILALALDQRTISTGAHFHPAFFEMLHAFAPNQYIENERYVGIQIDREIAVDAGTLAIDSNDDKTKVVYPGSREAIYEYLLPIFLKSAYPDLVQADAVSPAVFQEEVRELFKGKVSDRLNKIINPGSLYEDTFQEFYRDVLEKGIFAIDAIIEIEKSMELEFPKWIEKKGANATELREKIEGKLSKEAVLRAFGYVGYEPADKREQFLKRWINEASDEELQNLVIAMTGSKTLPSGIELKVIFKKDVKEIPVFHTCFGSMDLPATAPKNMSNLYTNYERFKNYINHTIMGMESEVKQGQSFNRK